MSGPFLADYIWAAKGEGRFGDLKERASRLGFNIAESAWQQWGNVEFKHRTRLPTPETIRVFAAVLRLSETEVLLAAARQLGLDVGEGNGKDLVLPGAAKLPPEDQDILVSLALSLLAKEGR